MSAAEIINRGRLFGELDSIKGCLTLEEGKFLYKMAKETDAEGAVLEIGSLNGRSSCFMASGIRDGNKTHQLFCIDISFQHDFFYNINALNLNRIIVPMQKNSLDAINEWNQKISILFIDGNHDYEHIIKEFKGFEKFVSSGGLIMLHDTVPISTPAVICGEKKQKDDFTKEWNGGPQKVADELFNYDRFGALGKVDTITWGIKK